MRLSEYITDPDALVAFEPDELGLKLLPYLAQWPRHQDLQLSSLIKEVAGSSDLYGQINNVEGHYPRPYRNQIDEALREAWVWLIGAALLIPHPNYAHSIMKLSRKAKKIAKEFTEGSVVGHATLSKNALHEDISEDVWALFHRGKYDTAVFEAMKAVEVAVRKLSGLSGRDIGVNLMRKAFDKTTGKLSDMTMEEGEREMRAHFFAGAIGSYKNPHSHRNVALSSPEEAAEIIMLANHLLRIAYSQSA